MYLLVRDLTGSRLAGFVSGVAFAFLPYRTFDTRIQVLMYGWTPLALWALHRYFTTGRRAALAAFAVAFLLQGLSNGYAFYSAAVAVVVVAVGLPARMRLRTLIDLTVTAVLMLALLLPVIGAYRRARVEHEWYRTRAENVRFSARARQYLPAWRPPTWGNRYRLSPGLALSGLAALGAGAALFGRRHRTGLTYAAVAGVGFVLSLGPEPAVAGVGLSSGPYDWLLAVVPGLDGLREPERFAVLVYVGAAVLVSCVVNGFSVDVDCGTVAPVRGGPWMANRYTRQVPALAADQRDELQRWLRRSKTSQALASRARADCAGVRRGWERSCRGARPGYDARDCRQMAAPLRAGRLRRVVGRAAPWRTAAHRG